MGNKEYGFHSTLEALHLQCGYPETSNHQPPTTSNPYSLQEMISQDTVVRTAALADLAAVSETRTGFHTSGSHTLEVPSYPPVMLHSVPRQRPPLNLSVHAMSPHGCVLPLPQVKEAVFSLKVERKSASLEALEAKLDAMDDKASSLEDAVAKLPGGGADAAKGIDGIKEQVWMDMVV